MNNFAAGTVVPTAASYAATGLTGFAIATAGDGTTTNLCNTQGAACAAADNQNVTVTVTTTGPSGTFAPVFASGFIYLYVQTAGVDAAFNTADDNIFLVGRVAGGTGVVTDTGAVRTYTNTMTVTAADVAGIPAATAINILAIGVNGSGAGLFSTVDATFTVVNGS